MLDRLRLLRDRLTLVVMMTGMDVLSDAIGAMRTGRPSSNRARVDSPWCYRFDAYDGAGFHVLLRGTGWVIPAGGTPIARGAGDVVLLPYGSAHTLSGTRAAEHPIPLEEAFASPNGDTDFLCGKY